MVNPVLEKRLTPTLVVDFRSVFLERRKRLARVLASAIPDMKFDIKEVLVAGDRVVVRGEVTVTPAGALFGAPHTGKSFRMMTIDIQTIKDGKIVKTFHMENWLSTIGQLRAK